MPHTPWPENGCSLAEARERTADRIRWQKWNYRVGESSAPSPPPINPQIQNLVHAHDNSRRVPLKPAGVYEQMINADFVLQLRTRRLIAYGRLKPSAEARLITEDIWPALGTIGWKQSTAGEGRRGGVVFHRICVYPALLAPCRVDLVADLSLAVAFKKFVLEDPEFVALARHTATFDKAAHPMLEDGQFARGIIFGWQWPIDLTPFPSFADVLNGAQTLYQGGSVIGQKSREACEVLRDRYESLLSLLQSGAVIARGTYALSGLIGEIDIAQWSRPSGWIDSRSGDLLEEIDNKLMPRWTGLSLSAPDGPAVSGRARKNSRPSSHKMIANSAASTGKRKRRVGDPVAKALRRIGLDSRPGTHTWKQIASMIASDMPKPPATALEMEALSKAVKRHYERRKRASFNG